MNQPVFRDSSLPAMNSQINRSGSQQMASLRVEQVVDAFSHFQPVNATAAIDGGAVGAIAVGLVVLGSAFAVVKAALRICQPNEILIVSGRKYRRDDGKEVGYRVIFGGRAFVIPIIEQVEKMDMTTMPIPVEVTNSYAKGGTPLNIQAIRNRENL